MFKKIVSYISWLVAVAVIMPLFHQIEDGDLLPYAWTEEGLSLEINDYTDFGFFPLKLIKKLNGITFFQQIGLNGKSLCRLTGKGIFSQPHSSNLPLFLLYHAFLFYDVI